MKIRSEFVTNSSSTSFGASAGDALIGIILGFGLGTLDCGEFEGSSGSGSGSGSSDDEDQGGSAAVEGVLEAAEKAAAEAAEEMAKGQDAAAALVDHILGEEGVKLAAQAQKIDSEIEAYIKQWEEASQSVHENDKAAMDKEYQEYIDYLKSQRELVEAQKYELQVAQAQQAAENAAKTDWVKQQQKDLVEVMEQKSFLEAVAKGYGAHEGYNVDEVERQLKSLGQREAELKGKLKENDAEISYTPKERDPIGPDPGIIKLQQEHKAQMAKLQKEIDEAKAARNDARRKELEREQAWNQQVADRELKKAAFWNGMAQTAEIVQTAADIGVESLSHVTGPAGKYIKAAYKVGKGVGGGLGEGMATGDYAGNIAKGSIKGITDAAKDLVKDKYGQKAQNIFIMANEPGKAIINSVIDGKTSAADLTSAAVKGTMKGASEVGVKKLVAKLPSINLPKGFDAGDVPVTDALKSMKDDVGKVLSGEILKNPNPYCQSLAKGTFKGGVDALKNYLKGSGDPGYPPSYPKQILDSAGSMTKTGVQKLTS